MLKIILNGNDDYEVEVSGDIMFRGIGSDIGQILMEHDNDNKVSGPQPPPPIDILKDNLKKVHVSMARAIESGDPLTIGLVLGQTVKELENLINS